MTAKMDSGLEGASVVVTGAGSGIGRAIAIAFANEDARVCILDRDATAAEETAAIIRDMGKEAVISIADIVESSQMADTVDYVRETFGGIDVLVNNTGIFLPGDILALSEKDWNTTINVNLTGMFICMKYFLPMMVEKRKGVIVNIGSEAGIVGIGGQVAYNVSKAGVIMLTKSCAKDLAKYEIRVNCVCPGRILTPLVQKILDTSEDSQAKFKELSEDRPMKRIGKPEDIAQAVLFLASMKAEYATGTVLSIDGGYTI